MACAEKRGQKRTSARNAEHDHPRQVIVRRGKWHARFETPHHGRNWARCVFHKVRLGHYFPEGFLNAGFLNAGLYGVSVAATVSNQRHWSGVALSTLASCARPSPRPAAVEHKQAKREEEGIRKEHSGLDNKCGL
eukprot:scaffold28298_cov68-Phaeocystis_antarctica.AAC.3